MAPHFFLEFPRQLVTPADSGGVGGPFPGNFFWGNGKRFWAAAKRKRNFGTCKSMDGDQVSSMLSRFFVFCLLVEVIVTSDYGPVKGTAGANPVVVAGAGAVASDVAGTPAAATHVAGTLAPATHVAGTPAPATHVGSTAAAEPVTGITDCWGSFLRCIGRWKVGQSALKWVSSMMFPVRKMPLVILHAISGSPLNVSPTRWFTQQMPQHHDESSIGPELLEGKCTVGKLTVNMANKKPHELSEQIQIRWNYGHQQINIISVFCFSSGKCIWAVSWVVRVLARYWPYWDVHGTWQLDYSPYRSRL